MIIFRLVWYIIFFECVLNFLPKAAAAAAAAQLSGSSSSGSMYSPAAAAAAAAYGEQHYAAAAAAATLPAPLGSGDQSAFYSPAQVRRDSECCKRNIGFYQT